ncbi:MAG: M48 family metallopeptidase [Firmicutes bacterium]|nr:M48 family metallopeptidase [Bacillota bacterium]
MRYNIDGIDYNVIIERKNNKNLYIRVKDDLTIYVTTNYFTTKGEVIKVLNNNLDCLRKMISKRLKEQEKKEYIYYLGKKYDLVISNAFNEVEITEDKIFVRDLSQYEKWLKCEIKEIFGTHLEKMYNLFEENIDFPKLKIRTMKTRWGVCNVKTKTLTLNSKLIEYKLESLDYVIVHELSHLIHCNHSKDFWKLVEKYMPDYKKIRADLKE